VDDEPGTTEMLKMYFQMMRFDVTAVLNGTDALTALAEKKFDAMLLDMMLPDIDGLEVCKRLRAKTETALLPVIVLSARTSREDIRNGYEVGATLYLKKPVDLEKLQAEVRKVIEVGHQVAPTLVPPAEGEQGPSTVIPEVTSSPAKPKENGSSSPAASALPRVHLQPGVTPASSNKR
jgi:DNA-binding response OmpR family regulator